MKYRFLIIAVLFVSSACSSNTNQNPNGANASANSPAVNADAEVAATNSNPPGMQPYNGAQNFNPNAFNAANDNLKVIKVEPKKDELPYGSRIAPDDSIISTAGRGKDFIETRTFKNHAVINKLEKIMDGTATKFKLHLKNGKVLDVPAEKMTNYASMAPQNILIAAGLGPKPQTNPPPISQEKKDQNQ